jgi:hypothetical protein
MAKRGEWHEAARSLRAAHPEWSDAKIAEWLGVGKSAVWKVLNPERTRELNRRVNAKRNTAKRAWDRAHKEARYDKCGCGSRKLKVAGRCDGCVRAAAEVRRQLAEGMWVDGWTCREMAAALGISKDTMGSEIAVWRRQGHVDAFPHRRTPEQVARIAAGWRRARAA